MGSGITKYLFSSLQFQNIYDEHNFFSNRTVEICDGNGLCVIPIFFKNLNGKL